MILFRLRSKTKALLQCTPIKLLCFIQGFQFTLWVICFNVDLATLICFTVVLAVEIFMIIKYTY